MTATEIRRAVLDLPMSARQELVDKISADLRLDERVIDRARWLSFRLRGALSKRT